MERGSNQLGEGAIRRRRRIATCLQGLCEAAERVIPEGVDLDRLANARRDYPIADLRIHPGELDAGFARAQEAIAGINADAVARAMHMMVDDIADDGQEVINQ